MTKGTTSRCSVERCNSCRFWFTAWPPTSVSASVFHGILSKFLLNDDISWMMSILEAFVKLLRDVNRVCHLKVIWEPKIQSGTLLKLISKINHFCCPVLRSPSVLRHTQNSLHFSRSFWFFESFCFLEGVHPMFTLSQHSSSKSSFNRIHETRSFIIKIFRHL